MSADQRVIFTGRKYKDHSDFWRTQLSRLHEGFVFRGSPFSRSTLDGEVNSYDLTLEDATSKLICSTGNDQDLGIFVVLLASFMALLSKYTGRQIVTVKSPLLARKDLTNVHADEVILAHNIDDARTLKEILSAVRETVAQSYKFQNFPLQAVFSPEELETNGNTNVLISYPQIHRAHEATDNHDLILEITRHDRSIHLRFVYKPGSFDELFIESFARHYQRFLTSFESPATCLRDVNILSEAERQQIIAEFNDVAAPYPHDKTIPELFEEQVRIRPDQVAVSFEDEKLTYRELNEKANQLAYYLRNTCGVKADDLVGLMVNRSERMVVAMLGILKSGAAYVPIDPEYPQSRIEYLLADTGVKVLLLDSEFLFNLGDFKEHIFTLDLQLATLENASIENIEKVTSPANLAYVIYTSGSTGEPKGVCITHGSINRLLFNSNYLQVRAADVVAQAANCSFDAITFELWGALLAGARLQIIAQDQLLAPDSLATQIETHQITVLFLTTALFNQMGRYQPQGFKGVRHLLFGGQQVDVQWVRAITESGYQGRLLHVYGPTEATTFATWHEVGEVEAAAVTIAIGKPIGNTQAYVLDEWQQLVPVGVVGELCIGGPGLARGYWQRAELTGERFIPHPFSAVAGERLYRTGDAVRYRADGELEFVGRKDQQVKVRGYRIELGEVESVLAQHPGVAECVVVARADAESTDNRLLAYVVSQPEQTVQVGEMRAYIEKRLPNYMVPAQFVMLDSLPLTANGKIDRQALPAPDQSRPQLEVGYVAPVTPEEEILAGIFEHTLKVEPVGIHDNFFDLGGDSLRAIQVISKARGRGLSLSISQLFQYATIFQLARQIKVEELNSEAGLPREPFSLIPEEDRAKLCDGIEDAYPLTRLQAGMLFHTEYNPESGIYNDIFSLHLKSVFDENSLKTVLHRLATRHAVLRTSFDFISFSEPLQLVHRDISIPLHIEDLEDLSPEAQQEKVAALIAAEKIRIFDWRLAPLMRARVYKRDAHRFQLTLSFHHAILDGWSVSSMLTEIFLLYGKLLKGEAPVEEQQLTSSFRDFVALERAALTSEEAQQYWSRKLSGKTATQLPRWPTSYRPNDAPQVGTLAIDISGELCADLRKLAHLAEVPIKSVLLAAHLRVMSLISGQPDVLTGVVSHGRTETSNGENVLGLFLNTLPFRQKLQGGTWIDLVKETFATERELLPFRRYPMAQIQKDLGGRSLFETAFNFVHFHVYQDLKGLDSVQLMESGGFEQTNFPFVANFSVNPSRVSQIMIGLSYYPIEFCEEQVRAIGDYYLHTLAAMATHPSTSYDSVSLLSPLEQDTILNKWNATQHQYKSGRCIHELFQEQVERTPEAVAVVFQEEELTYAQLNAKANQLAHRLQELGIGPEMLVGICMERSALMMAALLAVLKAGAAYVPLDAAYPAQRISFMLDDADVSVLLTQESLLPRLPEQRARVICLDRDWPEIGQQSSENLLTEATPDNLAYVIYTSGSTGQPKGVAIEHRSLLNLVGWHQQSYEINSSTRATQLASLGFDAAVWELWPYLCAGAGVYIVDEDTRLFPEKLRDWLIAKRITIAFIPTPLAQSLLELEWPADSSLQRLLIGGDKLTRRPSEGMSFEVINHYGPTENTVVATAGMVAAEGAAQGVPGIGTAIGNVQAYVLDEKQQLAPVGVSGELYLGGANLARGYWNRAELTAERFIPNPFSTRERLYRTGDLVRYLPNGELEFIGRLDEQVKIRGYRIELGEIESVLRQHPAVEEAVCVIRTDGDGADKRLVAYFTLRIEAVAPINELRSYLRESLPHYMVPSAFVTLDAMPVTSNGKLDRDALPAPEPAGSDEQRSYLAPTNAGRGDSGGRFPAGTQS